MNWKKNFFLFWIISFSIGPSFWSERSNIPLFLLILTDCIPYGIREEQKHSTACQGAVKKERKLFLEFTLFLFLFQTTFFSFFEPKVVSPPQLFIKPKKNHQHKLLIALGGNWRVVATEESQVLSCPIT